MRQFISGVVLGFCAVEAITRILVMHSYLLGFMFLGIAVLATFSLVRE